jgi:hypothetical protein
MVIGLTSDHKWQSRLATAKRGGYSVTSGGGAISVGGMVRPIVEAVFRFMISSNSVHRTAVGYAFFGRNRLGIRAAIPGASVMSRPVDAKRRVGALYCRPRSVSARLNLVGANRRPDAVTALHGRHLAKLAAIHPSATCRAAIKVLCFIFGRMALATADMVAAWELNDRTVLFGHWEISHEQGISDSDNP